MGCGASSQKDVGAPRRRPGSVGDVVVFLPGLRVPRTVDFAQALGGCLARSIVDRLSALRSRVVEMAMQESAAALKPRRRTAARHGSNTANLLQALEDYLPVLLGLVKEGSVLRHKVQFTWSNQEDNAEETAMSDAWYEVLSVLHLMAMVCLLQANTLLLPRSYGDGYAPRVSEESRRATVDVFLKAAGYLDSAIRHVLPKMPLELRRQLPVDLAEGNLKALSLQALGQGVDMQLGLAIDSPKATLAVKRRLACEMVKYWQQVQASIPELPISDGWGKKHRLFVKWKYVEAKAAAYYFHGLGQLLMELVAPCKCKEEMELRLFFTVLIPNVRKWSVAGVQYHAQYGNTRLLDKMVLTISWPPPAWSWSSVLGAIKPFFNLRVSWKQRHVPLQFTRLPSVCILELKPWPPPTGMRNELLKLTECQFAIPNLKDQFLPSQASSPLMLVGVCSYSEILCLCRLMVMPSWVQYYSW